MNPTMIVNKKSVNSTLPLKQAQKQEKRANGRGSRKPLKNYLGKIVSLASSEQINEESRVSNFSADISKEELLTAIENAGLTGMSGNGFSTHRKLTSFLASKSKDKILLINAVECDPALLHDEWILNNRYAEIKHTIHCLTHAFSLKKVVLATKDKNMKPNGEFTIAVVPPRYPMGEEHFLIRQTLGIHLENDEIPAERGILVLNVQSVYQIGKIINQCYDGGRFITIADLTKGSAKIAYVYPNDTISNLLNTHFGGKGEKGVYKGFGAAACTQASETDDFTNHETFAAYANPPKLDNTNKCRHCGSCKRRCPVNIEVAKIVQSVDGNKNIDYAPYHAERCIQCGSCTYFCPASKNVSGYITQLQFPCKQ